VQLVRSVHEDMAEQPVIRVIQAQPAELAELAQPESLVIAERLVIPVQLAEPDELAQPVLAATLETRVLPV
jgi:hypothetical protein